jgi:hypothetical protein
MRIKAIDDRIPVVYLSSYGEASRFANDFEDAITIITAFPGYWSEALVAAYEGSDRLAQVISHNEDDLEPEYAEARIELCELLAIDITSAASQLVTTVGACTFRLQNI